MALWAMDGRAYQRESWRGVIGPVFAQTSRIRPAARRPLAMLFNVKRCRTTESSAEAPLANTVFTQEAVATFDEAWVSIRTHMISVLLFPTLRSLQKRLSPRHKSGR